MEIEIRNERELAEWDRRIGALLQRHELDYVLGGIRQSLDKLKAFDAAGIALFAIRYSLPPIARPTEMRFMPWRELAPLANLVTQYLISDPVAFKPPVEDHYYGSTLIPIVLRQAANQFPFDVSFFGQYARTLKLFHHVPNQLKRRTRERFHIDEAFRRITGISITDFIDVGYGTFAVATTKGAFTGGWFQKARTQGMKFDEEVVRKGLEQLAADQWKLRDLYERYKQSDRKYAIHDFNPLLVHPLVRPWPKRDHTKLDEDRLIAPLPGLILTRLSEGVYHHLSHEFRKEFTDYFGVVFEAYVGEILERSHRNGTLLSERDVRRTYKRRKLPDYVLLDGASMILIECKATGLQRKAIATADASSIDHGVDRIVEGLVQLYQFRDACETGSVPLEAFNCSDVKLLIVTLEPFYIINSVPFKKVIGEKLKDKLGQRGFPAWSWYVLSVEELEKLQPHLDAGIRLSSVIDELLDHKTFNDVLQESAEKTGRSYKDSFLYEMDKEIWDRLNITTLYENRIEGD